MTSRKIRELLSRPVVVAPMAGGPSTAGLVIAAASAGALGFLAAGYKTPAAMVAEVRAVRAATAEPFGVNLFVPGAPSADPGAIERYLASLRPSAAAVGAELGPATWDDDDFDAKVAALLADPPPLVSFTFGCPSADVIAAFGDAGSLVAVTVTSPQEAAIAAAAGVDGLCVQGPAAGAHRGTFTNGVAAQPGTAQPEPVGSELSLRALVSKIAAVTDLPQIAAGGIMEPAQVQAVLAAGAVAAQCGTAFLRCPESGAHPLHKDALADPRFTTTALTRAFSGRRARGLVNRFIEDHADAPAAYPEINNATRPLRAAAAAIGDRERMSLWAGRNYRLATDPPAGEVIEWLSGGARNTLSRQANAAAITKSSRPDST